MNAAMEGDAAPWGQQPDDRFVLVRADICETGLWHVDGMAGDIADLPPIPPELSDRLRRWADWYDDLDERNVSFPKPSYWEQRADAPLSAFNAEGCTIAHALKAALSSDWTVMYEDVDAWLHPPDPPDADDRLILRGDQSV